MSYKETITEIMRKGKVRQYALSCRERKWTKFLERVKNRLFEIIEICKSEGRLFKLTVLLATDECLTLDKMSLPTKELLNQLLDKAAPLLLHVKVKVLYIITAVNTPITQEDARDLLEESDRIKMIIG